MGGFYPVTWPDVEQPVKKVTVKITRTVEVDQDALKTISHALQTLRYEAIRKQQHPSARDGYWAGVERDCTSVLRSLSENSGS